MSIKLIVITYLCFGGSTIFCNGDKLCHVSSFNELSNDKLTAPLSISNINNLVKMCELCLYETHEPKNDRCYQGGDYHSFHYGWWSLSIIPPKNISEWCYFDIFPPKEPFGDESKQIEDRIFLNYKGSCSVHNRFNVAKGNTGTYNYNIIRRNTSGNVIST